jgi:Uma2 family endonuclease
MAERVIPHGLLTVEEYLEMEESASVRHEYAGGMIYAQAGANRRHNRIAGNIFGLLWNTARGGLCRVYQNDMKLRTADDVFYYPDVMVVCEPVGESSVYEDSPCLVVEVASPSTESIDRREKMLAYRSIPTLRAYLIVAQDDRRVERYWRGEDGEWRQGEAVGDGSKVPIPCPGPIEITLSEVYEGLE